MVKLLCALIDDLKKAIKAENANPLKNVDADQLSLFSAKKRGPRVIGFTEEAVRFRLTKEKVAADKISVHVLVKVPEPIVCAASLTTNVQLPTAIALDKPEQFAEECISLDDWEVNAVHPIPSIWKFMSSLGGYKKSIVVGSPGIGKSTLFIVKLKSTSDKKGNVAYLQFTVTAKHGIDSNQLKEMNKIFYPDDVKEAGNTESPIYIAVCPDLESCKALRLDPALKLSQRNKFAKYLWVTTPRINMVLPPMARRTIRLSNRYCPIRTIFESDNA
ncbi:unnamed protein product [Peronospora farinosa]|uniref:Uncharacterized protein n=1 Tax=Peronospora farinosa TaxID=134698 RepID=A0ABN8CI34_9STRA|nr:unnamed protein product [Peronospora farinosa]